MWYQSHLKARVVCEDRFTPSNIDLASDLKTMGDLDGKKIRGKQEAQAITFNQIQLEAMDQITRKLQDYFNRSNQLDHKRWRSKENQGSLKLRLPPFFGRIDHDAYLEWEEEIELVFSCHHYTEEKKVRKVVSTFRGHAITWWEQTATTRRYLGEQQITSWFEMKIEMKKRFAPSPYSRDVHRGLRRRSPGSKGDNEQNPSTPPQQIPTGRKRDIRPLNQAYQPNQEELSHDSTFSRNLTQAGISEKKNRLKIFRHEEDMQLTNWRTC